MSYTAYTAVHISRYLTVVADLSTKSLFRYSLQLLVTRYPLLVSNDQVLENTSNDLVVYI
jgi:hypothetical protein